MQGKISILVALSPTEIVSAESSCALQADYPEVTEMVTTYEIYLREKNIAENCHDDSNQRKAHTQVCENIQCVVVCLRDINTKKKNQ